MQFLLVGDNSMASKNLTFFGLLTEEIVKCKIDSAHIYNRISTYPLYVRPIVEAQIMWNDKIITFHTRLFREKPSF